MIKNLKKILVVFMFILITTMTTQKTYAAFLDEKYFKKYPSDLYFRKNEIIKYFDLEDWCIEYIYERDKKDYCNYIYKKESRKVGYILAHKKRSRRKYKINYNIEVNRDTRRENKRYVIEFIYNKLIEII